ncbi:HIG1 domain family member 2A, mitochondrial [Lasioglossum baleicum]|uniref:HIG1 domain family member 2A, mitochondrial n=1 Tax=Lasioglossum baleicum TaxID=434251 RepID=UPI003FCD1392
MIMPEDSKDKVDMLNELDWVRLQNDAFGNSGIETFKEKLVRKTKENPMVPLGTIATVTALLVGLKSFYVGNTKMSQYMMRARVGAQAFTLLSIVAGLLLTARKKGQ